MMHEYVKAVSCLSSFCFFFNKLGPNNKVKHLSFADIISGNVIDGFKRRLANVPTL